MHKRLLIVFVLLLMLVVAESAFAQGTPNAGTSRTNTITPTEQLETPAERQERLQRIQNDDTVRSAVDPIRAQREIERQERLQHRCEEVSGSLEQYRTRFSEGAEQFLGAFSRISDQLEAVEARLAASGSVDTTNLQTQLARLREMIAAFEANKQEFVSELTPIRETACSDPDTSVRTQVQQSRQQLQRLRTEASSIRSYIQNTIRPELQRLRQQLDAVSPETE